MRDLNKNSRYCGTCEFWSGEREFNQSGACGAGVIRVVSLSGQCYKKSVILIMAAHVMIGLYGGVAAKSFVICYRYIMGFSAL